MLENDYLSLGISPRSGMIDAVGNKLTGGSYCLEEDQMGFVATDSEGKEVGWFADGSTDMRFGIGLDCTSEAATVSLKTDVKGIAVAITYTLRHDRFWVERRMAVDAGGLEIEFDRMVYGKLACVDGETRVLGLGTFDRPRLISVGEGGVFGGVAWWFCSSTDGGVYHHEDMAYRSSRRFECEPWYVGVFQDEPDEPFPGWLWYRTYLEIRQATEDKERSWCWWNAGWGHWGIGIEDPSLLPYIDLAHRLGLRSILVGGGLRGHGTDRSIELARTDEHARKNIQELEQRGMTWGCLEQGGLGERWEDAGVVEARTEFLDDCVRARLKAFAFDFFKTVDTFTAHRSVADYFRAARGRLDYTECHLGMAAYGPQFQREVLVNHPTDLRGFPIDCFSADWATFLGFRHSRREWQERCQYLMPEHGLYYFVTHYSNWGHPRQYVDPEPQQFLYGPQAYCGIGYSFHDTVGFRDTIAAASAFTPFPVFGHLELRMSQDDVSFVRDHLDWVADHAEILRRCRVCFEDGDACVVSKVRNGQGAVYLLNYGSDERIFRLELDLDRAEVDVRQLYPVRGESVAARQGNLLEVVVRAESVAVLEVGYAFSGLPPENDSQFPIPVGEWTKKDEVWRGEFRMPEVEVGAGARKDGSLPEQLISVDGIQGEPMGMGELPGDFLNRFSFSEDKVAPTWKFVPWAFAERVWLVYFPSVDHQLAEEPPLAKVNGRSVAMVPRVDYRKGEPQAWTCALFFADISDLCKCGKPNEVALSGLGEQEPPRCSVFSALDRY